MHRPEDYQDPHKRIAHPEGKDWAVEWYDDDPQIARQKKRRAKPYPRWKFVLIRERVRMTLAEAMETMSAERRRNAKSAKDFSHEPTAFRVRNLVTDVVITL